MGQNHGNFAAKTDHFDVGDGAETGEEPVEFLIGIEEWIAAGDENIADLRGAGDVVDAGLPALAVGGHFGRAAY